MIEFIKTLLLFFAALLAVMTPGESSSLRDTFTKDISRKCHYCVGNKKGQDNIEACSSKNELKVEDCPTDDEFDRCLVFQAFHTKLNTTIFRRECSSKAFCSDDVLCADPHLTNCKHKCCVGDLCNDFDLEKENLSHPSKKAKQAVEETIDSKIVGDPRKMEKGPSLSGISRKCHYCIGTEKGGNNVEACSTTKKLQVEDCPVEDNFDRCLVFQAFSAKLNTTIFRRECSSEVFCSVDVLCADPSLVDCKMECCSGDLCNDFDFIPPEQPHKLTIEAGEAAGPAKTKKQQVSTSEKKSGVSTRCYFCEGDKYDQNNTEVCSAKNELEIDICPTEDVDFKCIVFQAFSVKLNAPVVRKECIQETLCTEEMVCLGSDYVDCKFKCCTGDLCNDFDIKKEEASTTPALSTKDNIEPTSAMRKEPTAVVKTEGTSESTTTPGKEFSKLCYYCIGDDEGKDNREVCSDKRTLSIEHCRVDNKLDKCMVYEAFSAKTNTTFVRRECVSEEDCTAATLCKDPEITDCRFECCTGNLCNVFNLNKGVVVPPRAPTTTPPMVTTGEHGPEEECKDKDPNCKNYVTHPLYLSAFCKDNDRYTSVNCRKTCSFCKITDCQDRDPECKGLQVTLHPHKLASFCDENKHHMSVSCRRTCNFCTEKSIDETTETPQKGIVKKPTEPTVTEVCSDRMKGCQRLAEDFGYCTSEKTKGFVAKYCRKTCGICRDTHPEPTKERNTEAKTRAPIVATTCEDKIDDCKLLIERRKDYCDEEPEFMEHYCAKSCMFCEVTRARPTTEVKSVPRSTLMTEGGPIAFPGCKDKRADCPRLKANFGYCEKEPQFMKVYCPRTCRVCEASVGTTKATSMTTEGPQAFPECKDEREDCSHLNESANYCNKEPVFMKVYCRKTCGMCKESPPTSRFTMKPQGFPNCKDKLYHCAFLERNSQYCTKQPEFMNVYCRKTCRFCEVPVGTVNPQESPDCQDKLTYCPYFEEKSEYCTKQPEFMKIYCRRTCGLCKGIQKPTSEPVSGPTGGAQGPSSNCKDRMDNCPLLEEKSKYCSKEREFMKVYCRKTCGFCEGGGGGQSGPTKCEDKMKNCPLLEEKSKYCSKEPVFMKVYCQKTCGFCEGIGKPTSEPASGPRGVQRGPSNCTDELDDCELYEKKSKYCSKEPEFMNVYCRKTCGFCGGIPTPTSEQKSQGTERRQDAPPKIVTPAIEPATDPPEMNDCKDLRKDCKRLAEELNYCSLEISKGFVEKYCRKTCGICKVTVPEPTSEPTTMQKSTDPMKLPAGPPISNDCKDLRNDCGRLAEKLNYCKLDRTKGFVEKYCRKTCEICTGSQKKSTLKVTSMPTLVSSSEIGVKGPEVCEDSQNYPCKRFAEVFKYCNTYRPFMDRYCCQACKVLESRITSKPTPKPTSIPTTEQVTTVESNPAIVGPEVPDDCKDIRDDCGRLAEKLNYCKLARTKGFVEKYCRHTCGICRGTPVQPTEKPTEKPTTEKDDPVIGGPQAGEDCKDLRDDCGRLSEELNYCKLERTKGFVEKYCRHTCGICRGTSIQPTEKPTEKPTTGNGDTGIGGPQVTDDCKDLRDDCERLAEVFNYCKLERTKGFVEKYCRHTCGFCRDPGIGGPQVPDDCKDLRDDCQRLSEKLNYCKLDRTKGFVEKYCRHTCGICGGTSVQPTKKPTEKPTTGNEVIPPLGPQGSTVGPVTEGDCKDLRKDCKRLAEDHDYCKLDKTKGFVAKYCRRTCKVCTVDPPLGPVGTTVGPVIDEDCEDLRKDCKRLAEEHDYCKLNRAKGFVEKYCRRTCKVCTGPPVEPSEKPTEKPTTGNGGFPPLGPEGGTVGPTRVINGENDLIWVLYPWEKCIDGKQFRHVRCFHYYKEKWFQVIIDACIKYVREMPSQFQDCGT